MRKVWALLVKYREVIAYLICGGLTTLVNFGSYWLLTRLLTVDTVPANVAANALSILFAYVVNKLLVFRSRTSGTGALLTEAGSFFLSRLFSMLLDTAIVWLFADLLHINDIAVKLAANVVVVVVNYLTSKLVVFRRKERGARG